jgi:tetratricopeptide (TPR) repeat protein/mono/diheme cytochrome c family protein
MRRLPSLLGIAREPRIRAWRRFAVGILVAANCEAHAIAAVRVPQERPAPPSLTFSRDIAPLVLQHCASCHQPGGPAPFSLLTYPDVKSRARQIIAAVVRRAMPPWKPEPGYGEFAGSRRLSDDEVQRFVTWADQGGRAGDLADVPAAPRSNAVRQLGPPDLVLRLSAPFRLPASGPDRLRNFVIPIPIAAQRYVRGWEFHTNAPQVVHHATMALDRTRATRRLDERDAESGYEGLIPISAQPPDGYFLGWTPGQSRSIAADEMAWPLRPDTDLVLMMHLRPSGRPESVDARIDLYFSDVPPSQVPAMIRLNRQDIDIPAGDPRYVVRDSYVLPVDVDAYGVQPHAHSLAREMRAFATRPDGTREPLLYIRDWDFHWQDAYRYARPVFLPAGTEVAMEFTYDNSERNPANENHPPRRITYGQRTTDEMGDLWLQVVPRRGGDLAPLMASLRRKIVPQHIQGYRMMLRADPGNVGLHDDLALLSAEAGDLETAAAEFGESLRLAPEAAAAHYNVGNALLLLGRRDESVAHFRSALDRERDYGLAHQGLALALHGNGHLEEAASHFAAAVRLLGTAEAHYNLGVSHQARGALDAALAEYQESLRLEPAYGDALFAAGVVEAAMGRPAAAFASFTRALKTHRTPSAVQIELAWLLATSADQAVRDPRAAVSLAEQGSAGNTSARASDVLAAAMAASGRFEEALAHAHRALASLKPDEEALRPAIEERLALYRRNRAFISPAGVPR